MNALGLAQLREALGLDQSVQPGRVLVHAADAVQSMAQLSDGIIPIFLRRTVFSAQLRNLYSNARHAKIHST